MKCDGCGCQFPAREASEVIASEQIDSAGPYGAKTQTVRRTLCPACAGSRRGTMQFAVWVMVALAIGLGLIMLVGR